MYIEKLLQAPLWLTFDDVMLLPGRTSIEPREVDLSIEIVDGLKLWVPVFSSPMDTVTEDKLAIEVARAGGIGILHRNMPISRQVEQAARVKNYEYSHPDPSTGLRPAVDDNDKLLVGGAISPFDIERALKLSRVVDVLVSDIAHFHNDNAIKAAREVVKKTGKPFIAGNIGTYEAALDIASRIEDVAGFRVGISSGSICTTGEVTGVAAPTLTAVAQVSDALRELGLEIPVIADGGIRGSADAAKALAAGAWAVMLGRVLASTSEAPGETINIGGAKYKAYRGMASRSAREKRYAVDRYSLTPAKNIDEGIEGYVRIEGTVIDVLEKFVAGLKASLGYTGSRSIRDAWFKARFARITPLGRKEIGVHDVMPR